jgi:hypothetical protein
MKGPPNDLMVGKLAVDAGPDPPHMIREESAAFRDAENLAVSG